MENKNDTKIYMDNVAEQLAQELKPNAAIKKFLKNSAVIGAYSENSVLGFIRKIVHPLRVSTGAVISPELVAAKNKIRQIDVIIWQPNPLPSIFTAGDFGLIPRQSVIGILEIKRSAYSNVGKYIQDVLDEEDELTTSIKLARDGKILYSSLGVVCVKEENKSDNILDELIQKNRVVVLTELNENGDISVNSDQVMILVNFLIYLRAKARHMDGKVEINIDGLSKNDV